MRDYRKGVIRKPSADQLRSMQAAALIERDGKRACAICHIDIPEVIAIHHKDHNHGNNTLSNLMFLCFNCHFLHHMHPEAILKAQDWDARPMDTALFERLLKAVRGKSRPDQRVCIFHAGKPSVVTIGFDLVTGEPLPEEKTFGVCERCWKAIGDQ